MSPDSDVISQVFHIILLKSNPKVSLSSPNPGPKMLKLSLSQSIGAHAKGKLILGPPPNPPQDNSYIYDFFIVLPPVIGDVSLLDGWRTGTRQGVVLICFDNDGTLEWGVICTSYTWDDFNAKVYFDLFYFLFF